MPFARRHASMHVAWRHVHEEDYFSLSKYSPTRPHVCTSVKGSCCSKRSFHALPNSSSCILHKPFQESVGISKAKLVAGFCLPLLSLQIQAMQVTLPRRSPRGNRPVAQVAIPCWAGSLRQCQLTIPVSSCVRLASSMFKMRRGFLQGQSRIELPVQAQKIFFHPKPPFWGTKNDLKMRGAPTFGSIFGTQNGVDFRVNGNSSRAQL